jgi:hypothetical protein
MIQTLLVLMLGLTLMGPSISTVGACGSVGLADLFVQGVAVGLVTYVTYITRRLDREVRNGGE